MLLFIAFITIVALAPHNDGEMRGFTPCTYQLVDHLNGQEKIGALDVLGEVNATYLCYFSVIKDGMTLYRQGKQPTPWANYMFEPSDETMEDLELYPQDLLDANLLDNEKPEELLDNQIKENEDGQESSKE